MNLPAGTRLGPYEVVAPIGAGGMGEVYRARDTRLDRIVALKVLAAGLSANPQLRERFDREARTISQLSHPHICALYDVGHQDGIDYLVMEYLEGESLADRLARGAVPLDQVIRHGIEIAEALDRAHQSGVVHRDLKPGNIILTRSGAKLLDFGLARLVEAPPPTSSLTGLETAHKPLTREGTVLGTMQYMAPEQLAGEPTDARTDIFALGAVLYEMATGRRAFEGKSKTSLIAAIVDRDPVPVSTIQPLTPPALDHVIEKCLAKDPDDRWQSARDVAMELRWISEKGSGAGVAAPVALRRKTRERLAWSLAALLAIGFAALSALYRQVSRKPAPLIYTSITAPEGWTYSFDEGNAALSHDGSRIAFLARNPEGRQYLFVRSFDASSAQILPATEGASYPFWSADGRHLGFFADGKLKRIDASGGPSEPIAEAASGRGGAWSRDGVIVFAPSVQDPLYRVAATGGEIKPLSALLIDQGQTSHRFPSFLPDQRRFVYYVQGASAKAPNVCIDSIERAEPKCIVRSDSAAVFAPPHYLLFTKGTTLKAQKIDLDNLELQGEAATIAAGIQVNALTSLANISAAANGVMTYIQSAFAGHSRLTWFDLTGKELGSIDEPREYSDPRVSRDGRYVLMVLQTAGTGDIWLRDLTREVSTRLTFDPANEFGPVLSPDGRLVAYTNFTAGPGNVFIKPTDGTGTPGAIITSVYRKVASDWSSDGRYLFYHAIVGGGRWDLFYYDFVEKKAHTFLATPFTEVNAHLSPDRKWVAYVSDESGRPEIYVRPFPTGGGKWQISTVGGAMPVWSPDGRKLFFVSSMQQRLFEVDVATSPSFSAGVPRTLFRAGIRAISGITRNQYDIAPDGKRLLLNVLLGGDVASPPVTVVQNWTEKLRG